MESPHRLVLLHRNPLLRECLAEVLSELDGFLVEPIDHSSLDILETLEKQPCELILIDSSLPDQLAVHVAQRNVEWDRDTKVLALIQTDRDRESLAECIAAGVHGCVMEESSVEHLEQAIKDVLTGSTFCSREIVGSVFAEFSRFARDSHWRSRAELDTLTPRERDVLELICQRKTNKQIAKQLSVSLYTVKNHVHNILEKLRVSSRVEASDYARQRQWP